MHIINENIFFTFPATGGNRGGTSMLLNVSSLRIVDVVDHPDDLLQQDDDHQPSGSQSLQFFNIIQNAFE